MVGLRDESEALVEIFKSCDVTDSFVSESLSVVDSDENRGSIVCGSGMDMGQSFFQ